MKRSSGDFIITAHVSEKNIFPTIEYLYIYIQSSDNSCFEGNKILCSHLFRKHCVLLQCFAMAWQFIQHIKILKHMLESIHFPRGPSIYGINYQLIVYVLVVLMCSRTEYKVYLYGGLHLEYGKVTLRIV